MKKFFVLILTLLISASSALWAESFVQGGISFGTNIVQIIDSQDVEVSFNGLLLGYKGYHTLQIIEDEEDGKSIKNKNYDAYIPSVFIGYHGDKIYFTFGGELCRVLWAKYNSSLKLPFAYPTVSLGWDIRLWQNPPHNVLLNLDMSWYYCDLGDSYENWENTLWMFVPKFSIGVKYRFNFGRN